MVNLRKFPRNSETLCLASIVDSITKDKERNLRDYDEWVGKISRIKAMCYDLDKARDYLAFEGIGEFVSKFRLDVYSFGDLKYDDILQTVFFHKTQERLKSHKTIIEIENKPSYFWYEPDHTVEDRGWIGRFLTRTSPLEGGFLFSLYNSSKEDIEKLNNEFDKLEVLRESMIKKEDVVVGNFN